MNDDETRFADTYHQWGIFQSYARGKEVAEIGVRQGGSSRAFLRAPCKSLVSIELAPMWGVEAELLGVAQEMGVPWTFVAGDSLVVSPPEVDVLFIDSLHTYGQLLAELRRYSPSVREFILLHDTMCWGTTGEDGKPGLLMALDEFLNEQNAWKVETVHEIFPGLTILRRA